MPVDVRWENDERTINRYLFNDPWTWEDYHACWRRGWQMVDEVDHIVDIILDFRDTERIPGGALSHFRRAATQVHPNRGIVVVIGLSSIVEMLFRIIVRVYPRSITASRKGVVVGTLEEAYAVIKEEKVLRNNRGSDQ